MDKTSYNATCHKEYQTVVIGRQMETNYRQFVFNCAGFGDVAEITLVHQRSQDVAPYIVTSETGNTLTWTVTDTDTAFSGNGQAGKYTDESRNSIQCNRRHDIHINVHSNISIRSCRA